MRLVLLGPPGAGKGSQAEVLSERLQLVRIATGDLLREAVRTKTPLGVQAETSMQRGELVPDTLVTAMVLERLPSTVDRGFVLDGFPRTEGQAVELDAALARLGTPLDLILDFETSPAMIQWRLAGRWICRPCSINYHVTNRPPARPGLCDRCHGPLEQRADDRPETIAQRLRVYQTQTAPLLGYYRRRGLLRAVNGDLAVETLYQELVALFRGERLWPAAT